MVRVNLPDSYARTMLFGEKVQKDDQGNFIETDSTYADMAVNAHGGVIVEAPVE